MLLKKQNTIQCKLTQKKITENNINVLWTLIQKIIIIQTCEEVLNNGHNLLKNAKQCKLTQKRHKK